MNNMYRILIFLLLASLTACTATHTNMTVAGGDEDKDIGLGGTGILASTDGDASGLGGTGILGEITGFGSIFVNGIEIEYDNNTTFTIDGMHAEPQQLEIGDVVEVLTTDDNNHTRAQIINLRHEIIGEVQSVDAQTFSFMINGQSVVQAIHKVALPQAGDTVAVSGFRIDKNTILATRTTTVNSGQKLLREHTELPYKGKTDRWLVQTHVHIDKVSFELEGNVQTIELEKNTKQSFSDRLGIKILKLQKSEAGQLELNQVIEPAVLPRGRQTPIVIEQPVNIVPGAMQRTTPTPARGAQPGSMQNIRR